MMRDIAFLLFFGGPDNQGLSGPARTSSTDEGPCGRAEKGRRNEEPQRRGSGGQPASLPDGRSKPTGKQAETPGFPWLSGISEFVETYPWVV
jgi:hypothetical protein